MQRLRIGYLTSGHADDLSNWSGLVTHMRDALRDYGHEVMPIDGLAPPVPYQTRMRGWWSRFVLGKPYGYDRDLSLAQCFANLAEPKLARLVLDCVVSPQTYPVTMLRSTVPVASWCDATFHALMQVYPGVDAISASSIAQGHRLERNALERNCLTAYASQWAADDAVNFYGANPEKIAVVPFGANCAAPFVNAEQAERAICAKPTQPFRMLFVGSQWERKGGSLALAILSELRQRGIDAELWVAGSRPFTEAIPAAVKYFGHLDKAQPADLAIWRECFAACHVFLLPTRAECFGVVFAEAAAFALPSIATRVGGVADAVTDGVSGILFDPADGAAAYCDVLQRLATDLGEYRALARSAHRHYLTRLNWRTAAAQFSEQLLARLPARA